MINRLHTFLASRIRRLILGLRGVRFDGKARLNRVEVPCGWSNLHIGDEAALDNGVVLIANGTIEIGAQCYVNRYTILDAHQSIKIGARCMIGPHCYITDSNHGSSPGSPIADQPIESEPVVIGEGAWIGANVNILAGVSIGAGAIIGAGSVVTRAIAPNTIAAGVPAKPIRERA